MDNEFLAQAFQTDNNIQAIGDGPSGKKVMYVLDREKAAPYIARDASIEVIECNGFGIGPPIWPDVVQPKTYKDRMRPVPGGPSVGSYRISAGTVSCFVKDKVTNELLLLSNNHVLANVDNCVVGDDILQPGPADGGQRSSDTVANLLRWVPIQVETTRYVDCAVARMKSQQDIDQNVIALGYPHGLALPYINQWLKKTGRTTETTSGPCAIINASVRVNYGSFTKTIQDCILTGVPSAPGDSGSLMMDFASNAAVALLFAGGVTSGGTGITVGCRADRVEQLLNVTFPPAPKTQKRGGIDVSKWQGLMDWQKAYDAGIRTAIIRAGSVDNITGICYKDDQFDRNAQLAPPLMPIGFYWYFRPNHNAITQAEFFCDLIQGVGWKVPPVIDVEEDAGMSQSEVASAIWVFLDRVYKRFGVSPIIYTSPGFWNSSVGQTTWAKDYPLWVANWVNDNVLYPLLPNDWKNTTGKLVMWQYRKPAGNGLGSYFGAGSPDIDMDTTYPPFELFLEEEPPPPPETVSLIINFVGYGYVEPDEGEFDYGTSVQLEAFPSDGWEFLQWEGDLVGAENPITLVMNSDKTVTAVFIEDEGDELATEEHYLGLVQVGGLRIRSDAGTSYPVVGVLTFGKQVEILEAKKDNLGNDWVRIGNKQWSAQYYKEKTGWKEYIRYMLKKFL